MKNWNIRKLRKSRKNRKNIKSRKSMKSRENMKTRTREGLHSVVSHKSDSGNQEIRQLEL